MQVDYVSDTSTWEKWQRDYRLGLILIMPPDDVAAQVNGLRAKYDPRTYAYCPAHVTLSDPLGLEMTPERDEEISRILRGVTPFRLRFEGPHASRDHAGVAYAIYSREAIDDLRATLHQASVFTRPPYWTRKVPPHMTIAEFVTIEESWRILEEIKSTAPQGSFLVDRLEFIVPDSNMHFHRVKSYELGTARRPSPGA